MSRPTPDMIAHRLRLSLEPIVCAADHEPIVCAADHARALEWLRDALTVLDTGDYELLVLRVTRPAATTAHDGPRRMRARYPGRCAACCGPIAVDDAILYDGDTRSARHEQCGAQP